MSGRPAEIRPIRTLALVEVNWNGGDLTRRSLASVASGRCRPDAIYLVDNGSVDDSLEGVEKAADGIPVRIFRNDANLGFAKAVNRGIRAALADGADAVFLLNNDALLNEDTLAVLLEAVPRHPRGGLFAPKILSPEGRLWCAGMDVGLHPNLQKLRGLGRPDAGQFDREEPVDALTGCGLLIRREVFEEVGDFDEDFFVYVEDLDFCLRARSAGFLCVHVPGSCMIHAASSSTGGGYGAWRKHMLAYNLVTLLKKRGTPSLWGAFVLVELAGWPLLLVSSFFRGRTRAVLAKGRGMWRAFLGGEPDPPPMGEAGG